MCTYNGAKYIREQLDSILAQTYPATEIVIQDDGSTDDTVAIIKEYQQKWPQVVCYRNEGEHGVNPNFFSAIKKAKGDYVAISDQDDIWEENKLEWQMEVIGDKLLCSGRSIPFPSEGYDMRTPNYSLLRLIYCNSLPGHTMFFPKRLLNHMPDLPPPRTYDVTLAIIAASFDSIAYVDRPLVRHRMHQQSATFTPPTNNKKTLGNMVRYIIHTTRLSMEIKDKVKDHLKRELAYMMNIHSSEPVYKEAIKMLRYQTGDSALDAIRYQLMCVKHCDKLLYVPGRKTLPTMLRGLLFPVYVYEYFRYMSKR